MDRDKHYFFCGIGGSGMLPLALIIKKMGFTVSGSDRALDQGRESGKFARLRERGIPLFPQDGSGITDFRTVLVASAAVEETVPDVQAALRIGALRMTRAQLLAELFNAAPLRIGVAGTSGKSTTTGMTGWIMDQAGLDPTIVNGAAMTNYLSGDDPFASARAGGAQAPFLCEIDESDGSIALFRPDIALVNNVSLDHKPLGELRALFGGFVAGARVAVLNRGNDESLALAKNVSGRVLTYGIEDDGADLGAWRIAPEGDGAVFDLRDKESGAVLPVTLRVPGRHNVANALAALAAARACGVSLDRAVLALAGFTGLHRRLERVGTVRGVTVIDDFAHNPDKIAASLAALHEKPGRLLILFQPHGFGPLALMKDALIAGFAEGLAAGDVLALSDPVYFGGTAARTVSSGMIADGIAACGRTAFADSSREALGKRLAAMAEPGDRIVVMGARDDSLSSFAADLLTTLSVAG